MGHKNNPNGKKTSFFVKGEIVMNKKHQQSNTHTHR